MKTCTKCGSTGPFSRDRRNYDGLQYWCKACSAAIVRKWRTKHMDRQRELEHRWHAEHPGRRQELVSRWHAEHPGQKRRWCAEHPEEVIQSSRMRRAREMQARGIFTAKEWAVLKAEYGHRCAYCGRETERLQSDHIIPLNCGGSNDILNIIPACQHCNASKGDTPLLIWMLRQRSM